MKVLGINSAFHESAAAVVVDGRVVAAVEEERFNRRKHAKPADVDNAHELPTRSIEFCLAEAGIAPDELDLVAYSFDVSLRRDTFRSDPLSSPGDWGSAAGEESFLTSLDKVPSELSSCLGIDVSKMFRWVPHHLAHAASAYYPGNDVNAAVLVVDGIGEMATTFLGGGTQCGIHRIAELRYPNSIGFVWEKMSAYLGFSPYDASKVMGLASYGNPDKFFDLFNGMVEGADILDVRSELFQFRLDTFSPLEELLGPRRNTQEPIDQRHADIAATLQGWNNSTILALAERVYEMHPAATLCYSGGVALNCTTNWVLKEKGPFTRIHIPPAPHDGGTAAGAALHAYHVARGPEAEFDLPSLSTPYTGPQFDEEQILAAFAEMQIVPVRSDDPALEAAGRIADGQVVGWFQGRMEIGPRALGNRSLLADPRDPHMRDMLNRKVKHREDFRPFAPSVLAEHAATWFSLGRSSESYDYMLYTCSAHPELAQRIPAVVHTDGTSRVQLVSSATNPLFHSLIEHFHDQTGVPMVLNTSFNDSEPIVCTPQDALKTFLGTKIDAVVIGNYTAARAS